MIIFLKSYQYAHNRMFKQILPSMLHLSNITPEYIISMYEEKEDKDIDYILFSYIMTNKVKQLFIKKNKEVPTCIKMEIKKLYDKLKADGRCNNVDITTDSFIDFMYDETIRQHKNIKDYEKKVKQEINEKYKKAKDAYKYANELHDDKCKYYVNGENLDNPLGKIVKFMGDRQGAKVFTYNQRFNEFIWLDEVHYQTQFKQFKKLIKDKKIVIDKENNNEHTLNGVKWYSVCIQVWDKEENDYGNNNICLGSMSVFNYMISGYVYYFKNQKDRDNAYNWLVK